MVAGRHVDGRDDLRRRHAAGRDGPRRPLRHRGQLAVVEHGGQRDAHRLRVRAAVAPLRRDDRRRARRAALRG